MKLKAMILASVFLACVARASAQDALPWSALPEADAVAVIEVSRLINEGVPRFFSASPAALAKVNAELDRIRDEDGFDPRAARSVVTALRFAKASGPGLVSVFVGVDAAKIIADLDRKHRKRYSVENFQGRKIYVEKTPLKARKGNSAPSSMFDLSFAIAELSSDTLVLGTPDEVRASIEALSGTKPRLDRKLIEAVQRHPSALLSFAVAATPKSASASSALDLLRRPQETGINDDFLDWLAILSSMRLLTFAVAPTSGGMELVTTAEMETEQQAGKLADMVASLKNLLAPSKPGGEAERIVMDLIGNMRVSVSGREVISRLDVPQSSIDYVVQRAMEMTQAKSASSPARSRSPQRVARRRK